MNHWAALLLLPGVALLIMSTSIRYARLHDELHHVVHAHNRDVIEGLLIRARWFRDALIELYVCCSLLAAAGLITVLGFELIALGLTVAAVLVLLVATITLSIEARASFRILALEAREQLEEMSEAHH